MYPTVSSLEHFNELVSSNDAVLFYFSNDDCNVCKVLKPKVYEMLESAFPKTKFFYVDTKQTPEVAAQNRVFTIPTIIVFFAGSELFRKSRYIGMEELQNNLARPYELMFT